jgi:co-chaperonin GroES (HSP10)
MKPLNNKILVAETVKEQTTSSGIVIAGADLETGSRPAVVVAVGPDVTSIKAGDKVAIKWSEALAVTINGEQRALVEEENIWGIFD